MIVNEYKHGACHIVVHDDYYANRTEEQRKEDLDNAEKIARQIVLASMMQENM